LGEKKDFTTEADPVASSVFFQQKIEWVWLYENHNDLHTVIVGGNFANFGVVDFYYAPSQIANVIFNGVGNSAVSGIGTWDLNTVTLNKSGSTAALLNVQSNNFELGIPLPEILAVQV